MKQPRSHPGHSYRITVSVVCCLVWILGTNPVVDAHTWAISSTTIHVNTTIDESNTDGDCSLREAIQAANTDTPVDGCPPGSGTDTILLPAGTFTLTKVGIDENFAATGDLDITNNLVIIGVSPTDTRINGNHTDRIFDVLGSATLSLNKMTLYNGWIAATGLYGGGAILNRETGTLELNQVVLQGNTSQNVGGGIDNAGTARLNFVTLDSNQATSESATVAGGAIYNGGSLMINNSLLSNNTAFNPNSLDYGGGLFNEYIITLVNVTFSHCFADWGGGLFNQGIEANMYNVTFADNSTAIYTASPLRIKNSIVANSTAGENCSGGGTITSLGHNIDNGSSCNFDLENTNPLLGPLADNLGLTYTHALLGGSPAIDSGDNNDCPDIDQRGAYRPADGDFNSTPICDIGAFEYQATFPIIIYLPILNKLG